MVSETLAAELVATKDSLSKALQDVARAAAAANNQLSEVNEELAQVSGVSAGTAESIDKTEEEMNELSETVVSFHAAAEGIESDLRELAAAQAAAADAADQHEEQLQEERNAMGGVAIGSLGLSGVLKALSGSQRGLAAATSEAEDEMEELQRDLLSTAGAAQLLNLETSALSINVGFMTVALRNATTQIPALVAGLGNLGGALTGVASAAVLAAGGFAGIALAGFAAQTKEISGTLTDMESTMQAMRAIGEEVLRMFLKAVQPLMQAEGIVERFQSILETTMLTVQQFSKGLARSFEAGEQLFGIADFMDEVGAAWKNNLADITAGFQTLFHNIGPILSGLITDAIRAFDDFAVFISEITRRVSVMLSAISGPLDRFIEEFIRLGQNVGAGLVPVMNAFFNIMASIAETINSLGTETIGTIVKMIGFSLILSKVAGVAGQMIVLFSALPKVIYRAGIAAQTAAGGFGFMINKMRGAVQFAGGGMTKLGNAVKSVLPSISFLNASLGVTTGLTVTLASVAGAVVAALAAIVVIGGAVVLLLAKMGTEGEKFKQTLSTLKDFFFELGDRLLPIFIASANMLLGVIKGTIAPFKALMDALGADQSSMFDTILQGATALKDMLVPFLLLIGDLAQRFGQLLVEYIVFVTPVIKKIVGIVKSIAGWIKAIVRFFIIVSKIVFKVLDAIAEKMGFEGVVSALMMAAKIIRDVFVGVSQLVIDIISGLTDVLNKISSALGDKFNVDASLGGGAGASLSGREVQRSDLASGVSGLASAFGKGSDRVSPKEQAGGVEYNEGDVHNNYEQNIQADPEDKAQLSRIAKDAMEEANSFSRRQQGGQ